MIKTIIKNDGTRQEFDPNKVNGWGIWAAATLGKYVDWGDVVLGVVSTSPSEVTSKQLQQVLIDNCLARNTWSYNRMAGRLYSSLLSKKIYGDKKPTVQALFQKMTDDGLMDVNFQSAYSIDEYAEIEKLIDHKLDLTYAHYQIKQFRDKYALRNRVLDIDYETPQFTCMRVAMRLSQNLPNRMEHVKNFYFFFSRNKLNVPTPYYTNSGTAKNGFLSCCLYTTLDEAPSLAAGDHIAYMMTVASAGIGANIMTRTLNDKVRGGTIKHQGKLPYYRALVGAISANLQNGRGGAATTTYSVYDPQVDTIQKLKNPMTPDVKKIRDIDYAMSYNHRFAKAAANNEDYHTFSFGEVPDLYEAMCSGNTEEFDRLYDRYVAEGKFKEVKKARDVLRIALEEAIHTGRHYVTNLTEINRHTPFKEYVWNSNLCQEVTLPTKGYKSVEELYQEKESGEIAMCALSGIVVANIDSDDEYAKVAYYALLMIDVGINETDYPFPQLKWTATKRMSAAVGIVGLAHLMAKNKMSYQSQKGLDFMHQLAETHYWHLANASLKLGQEFGNAEWIGRTKWVDGWLPIDTYNRNVDEIVTVGYNRDWEDLRARIKKNGGIRNSVLVAHMPSESSSISSGTTNGIYPIRQLSLLKTSNTNNTNYVVPDSEKLKYLYEFSWDIPSINMAMVYGIFQKWDDQAISADIWKRVVGIEKIKTSELLQDFFDLYKYGVKTRYYINSMTAKGIDLNASEGEVGCVGGGCSL